MYKSKFLQISLITLGLLMGGTFAGLAQPFEERDTVTVENTTSRGVTIGFKLTSASERDHNPICVYVSKKATTSIDLTDFFYKLSSTHHGITLPVNEWTAILKYADARGVVSTSECNAMPPEENGEVIALQKALKTLKFVIRQEEKGQDLYGAWEETLKPQKKGALRAFPGRLLSKKGR